MTVRDWVGGRAAAFALGMFAAGGAAADGLLDLYLAAVEADPKLQAATYERQADDELVTQAWAGYRPTVTFDYDYVKTTQDIISSDNTVFQKGATSFPSTTWSLTLSQPVFRYANYVRIGQAKAELQQADAELVQAQQDLILRLAESYFGALAAEDELGFLQAERMATEQKLDLAIGRENARIGRVIDRFDAEARLASVQADYAEAQVSRGDAYEQLFEITGRDVGELDKLLPKIDLVAPEPADPDFWVAEAQKNNPVLVAQRFAVDVAGREVSRQNAGHYPTVDFVFRNTNQVTEGTLFGGGSEVETREMMLRMSVPLYAGGSVSSKKREAVARHFSAKSELTRLSRESRRQVKEAYWGVVNAVKRVDALTKAVEAQEATLTLRRRSFEAGLETAISVLDAERDLYFAKRDLARAKYDYLLNGLRLKALAGILTQEDLQQLSQWLQS